MTTKESKLNSVEKKALAEILNRVASSHKDTISAYVRESQRAVKERHQDEAGVPEQLKKLELAREEVQEAEEKKRIELENFKKKQDDDIKLLKAKEQRIIKTLAEKGFDEDGDYLRERSRYGSEDLFTNREGLRKSQLMQEEFNKVEQVAVMRSNKLDEAETLIWTAQTKEEAEAVMGQVIGGGLIDGTMTFRQLEAPKTDK